MTLDVGDKTSQVRQLKRVEGRVAMIPARHWDRPRPLISLRQVQNVRRNCLLNKLTHSGTRVIYFALRDDLRRCKDK